MNKTVGMMVVVILLFGAAIGWYVMQETDAPEIQPEQAVKPSSAPVAPAMSQPVQESAAAPLPQLKDSDPVIGEAISNLFGADTFEKYFRPEKLVRNIVVTIDNLPRKTVSLRLFPVKPVGGKFRTQGDEENLEISPANAARYKAYVGIFETIDAEKLVAVYSRFSPLFQRAYQELGYPTGSFNDRLITVIDHLLDAPEIKGPLRLVQPNVMYLYEDPGLESKSSGHKILMRVGLENEARIKSKLRQIRRELASQFSKQLSKG